MWLITGPFDFLWTYVRNEAGCQMQTTWEQTVLAESQGATGHQASAAARAGRAGLEIRQGAAPFLTRSLNGYAGKDVLGAKIPFVPDFLPVSSRRRVGGGRLRRGGGKSGTVRSLHQGLPTDANPEARVKPHGTRLGRSARPVPRRSST